MSICDPKDKDIEETNKKEEKTKKEEKEEKEERRKDSMMVPAFNFARRMSMRITGGTGPFQKKH